MQEVVLNSRTYNTTQIDSNRYEDEVENINTERCKDSTKLDPIEQMSKATLNCDTPETSNSSTQGKQRQSSILLPI
jgi:hypothetical protein